MVTAVTVILAILVVGGAIAIVTGLTYKGGKW